MRCHPTGVALEGGELYRRTARAAHVISTDPDHLLFVYPERAPSPSPLIDGITRKMIGAWRVRTQSEIGYRGVHMWA